MCFELAMPDLKNGLLAGIGLSSSEKEVSEGLLMLVKKLTLVICVEHWSISMFRESTMALN
ncbi:hypothetical protein GJ744_006564 [Endocarpon pusillum]|uniref:Uncharacterized protein n=1 Tax=Endocarpon pusillum TaxID=364733 RepID=A0A8H7AZE9_9EURO|nr:hypothetical protein GJ744_006564 [Endocarpon pusillum]